MDDNVDQPLVAWKKRLRKLEGACPWPGPRPLMPELDGDKIWRLAGRDEDIKQFIGRLQQHQFLVLHGVSGVGKSSLLQIGLIPVMEITGFEPIICSRWSVGKKSASDIETYIRDVLLANLADDPRRERIAELIGTSSVAEGLLLYGAEQGVGRKTVLILDQFEEYIRLHEQSFSSMANWLESINKDYGNLKIVLSLRSDFTYILDEHIFSQNRLRGFSFDQVRLAAIEDAKSIKRIINPAESKSYRDNNENQYPIDADACEALYLNWENPGPGSSSRTLLGLQALLYALYWLAAEDECKDNKSIHIKTKHVEELKARYQATTGGDVFLAGFFHTIRVKLNHCEQATREGLGIASDIIAPVAKLQLYRAVPLLSLGGFKVVQDLWLLCKSLFKDEFDLMHSLPKGFDEYAFTRLESATLSAFSVNDNGGVQKHADLLLIDRKDIIRGFFENDAATGSEGVLSKAISIEEQQILAGGHLDTLPWIEDPGDITSGAMLGMDPIEVLVELLRIFWFVIVWLEESKICRVLKGENSSITIVHDKLGEALMKWRDEWIDEPSAQIVSLVETVGVNLDWRGQEIDSDGYGRFREFGTADDSRRPEFLINLRWRSCNIQKIKFKQVEFVNCDFRSTRFDRCVFEGTAFVNCLLDGAMFDHCTIKGATEWQCNDLHGVDPTVITDYSLPAFSIRVDQHDLDPLVHYRGKHSVADSSRLTSSEADTKAEAQGTGCWLFSAASGVAARPASGKIVGMAGVVSPLKGGMALIGGRISTLMFRNSKFDKGGDQATGAITLAYVAGSSLEFVEHDSLNLSIVWSALRNVTVTRSIERKMWQSLNSDKSSDLNNFLIKAEESMLDNVWFGEGLRGKASFDNCTIFSLASLSRPPHDDDEGFEVDFAENCVYGFAYNTEGYVDAADVQPEEAGRIVRLAPNSPYEPAVHQRLRSLSEKADYRSVAARFELLHHRVKGSVQKGDNQNKA
jgi:hypothetical protein